MELREQIFDQMNKIEKSPQFLPAFLNAAALDEKISAHRVWLQGIRRERPDPAKPYRIGVYIRYFNQTRYQDYLDYHKRQFMDTIGLCPSWTLVDFYVDEGSTAPNMESSPAWRQLLEDCMDGKVDLILTQKISNVCVALKAVLEDQIAALVNAGFTQFLSGMAEATDTWCALSVLSLREKNPAIKLHCILPCKEQADKWSASSRDLYHSILERADSIVYVSRRYYKNCMLDRNRFLVDHAAALLAVYNGERRGGMAATMRYAQKMGREIIVIDPTTRLITHDETAPSPAQS